MTGLELVDTFYAVNLNYLNNFSNFNDIERDYLVLFLLGLVETVYFLDSGSIHSLIPEYLNAN